LENNKFLFENVFDIFLKTNKTDTIFVLSNLRLEISEVTSKLKAKFKEANKFNQWLLEKLSDCVKHFKKNWNYTDENNENYVDISLFNDFISGLIYYIKKEIKDRSCAKSCLLLAIDLLNLSQDLYNQIQIEFISDIFNKENFYLLKDHQSETQAILKLLIDLAVEIENNPNFDSENNREQHDYNESLNYCIDTFQNRIQQTSNLTENLEIIHEILFERIIFEPVESNFVTEEYFKLINNLMELVSFDYFPDDKIMVERLKTVYQKAISADILESFVNDDLLILPLSTDLFLKEVSIKFASLLLSKNYENPISQNYIALLKLVEYVPEFFFLSIPNKDINAIEIFECSKNVQNELNVAIGTINHLFQILNSNGLDKEYFNIAFNTRKKFYRILFVEGEIKIKDKPRTLLNIPYYKFDIMVQNLCSYYNFLAVNSEDRNQIKTLIDDLVELFEELKSKDAATILSTIEFVGKCNNKKNKIIIKEYHQYFLNLKNDKKLLSISEIEVSLNSLINYIEDRNIETFTKQLSQNTSNISKLDRTTRYQETEIRNVYKSVNKANEKIEIIENTVDKQGEKIEIIDGKTLFNLPLWCKDISKKLTLMKKNNWILVAKRLNFNEKDIKGWQNQVDPCMSMLQEWFVLNKTSDAIVGLLNTFRELDYQECVKIIEKNQQEIDIKNQKENIELNEEKLDKELINQPPQIFICFEWSSKDKAELLRKYLISFFNQENNNNRIRIWFDDGVMGGGESRNNRIDIGLRSCYVLICLINKEIVNDKTCLNQINLAVQLNKAIIPLLIDNKLKWPPQGSLGTCLVIFF